MKKSVLLMIVTSVIFGATFIHTEIVQAVKTNFSVSAIIPDNQIDKSKTYFDLRVEPGQVQVLEVLLSNGRDDPLTVETSARTATTNNKGLVDYDNTAIKKDETLRYPFSEMAELPKEVTIPARQSKTLKVKVTTPSKPFSGVILGGIHISEKDTQIKRDYIVGVIISENSAEVKADMKLNGIKLAQDNHRNVLKVNVQNPKPMILPNLAVDAHVYREGSEKLLYETKEYGLRMAPNSNFDFSINWNNQRFQPGKYRLKMVMASDNRIWKWEEPFEITSDVAAKLNDTATLTESNDTIWYIIGVSVVILLGIVYVWRRHSRED
ncbi:DUF916 and DUF3324 domain-containing protein [Listeria weihenstephanensis]|uniref:DUF916 and DUF3324 domain-containing protein n=1 Tax=Listeria weihenstephanensis TaxID=1006155 RepID=A0A841ZAM2_9LIST|nr:DUF916 and DUF3324 domain-containing protein [Listeria weihenstephanensis]MBC1501333.1 DUF916 and DUF3324 domain-containing protein [Listeria weihenstephanensis]